MLLTFFILLFCTILGGISTSSIKDFTDVKELEKESYFGHLSRQKRFIKQTGIKQPPTTIRPATSTTNPPIRNQEIPRENTDQSQPSISDSYTNPLSRIHESEYAEPSNRIARRVNVREIEQSEYADDTDGAMLDISMETVANLCAIQDEFENTGKAQNYAQPGSKYLHKYTLKRKNGCHAFKWASCRKKRSTKTGRPCGWYQLTTC